jgi:NADH-quinone oxidoreductase subunit J
MVATEVNNLIAQVGSPGLNSMYGLWALLLAPLLGMAAVYFLLPRPHGSGVLLGALTAALALLAAGWLLIRVRAVTPEVILFYAFSLLAVVAGGLMLVQRNPVHAALSFALVVLSTCGLFLLQAAPFLMAATIIVYAGAIVVTFLFVIMLAQQEGRSDADHRSREPLLACTAGFVLLGALCYVLQLSYNARPVEALLEELQVIASKPTEEAMLQAMGGEDRVAQFFRELDDENIMPPGYAERPLKSRVDTINAMTELEEAYDKKDLQGMRHALEKLQQEIRDKVLDNYGNLEPSETRKLSSFSGLAPNSTRKRLPGEPGRGHLPEENTVYLGRSLFTDFLLPVELAGTILLVAAIGTIAITYRRTGGEERP